MKHFIAIIFSAFLVTTFAYSAYAEPGSSCELIPVHKQSQSINTSPRTVGRAGYSCATFIVPFSQFTELIQRRIPFSGKILVFALSLSGFLLFKDFKVRKPSLLLLSCLTVINLGLFGAVWSDYANGVTGPQAMNWMYSRPFDINDYV